MVHSCSTLEVSDHSCTQNTGKISAPEIGNSTPAPVNLVLHSRDLVEKGHALQTGSGGYIIFKLLEFKKISDSKNGFLKNDVYKNALHFFL